MEEITWKHAHACVSWYQVLLEKYPTFFLRKSEACLHEATLNLHTDAWIFSCLSVPSVDGKQHLIAVVFRLLSDFHCTPWVHTTGSNTITEKDYRDVFCCLRDAVWCKRQELWSTGNWRLHHSHAPALSSHLIQIFFVKNQTPVVCQAPYSPDMTENPMRSLNTTSLKCCSPSTDAIDRWENIYKCLSRFKVGSCKCASLKSIGFANKKIDWEPIFLQTSYISCYFNKFLKLKSFFVCWCLWDGFFFF